MATNYHDVVLADSPVFAGLGIVGSDGTVVGSPGSIAAPTLDTGDAGFQFDGSTEYVLTGLLGAPNTDGPFSVEMWVMPTSAAAACVLIGSDPDVLGTVLDFSISMGAATSDPQIFVTMSGGGSNTALDATGAPGLLRVSSWNHLVFTWDGVTGVVYINGTKNNSTAVFPWSPLLSGQLAIAGLGHVSPAVTDNLANAGIADVSLYAYPLSAQKVMNHFGARNGVPAFPPSSGFTGDYWKIIQIDNPLAYYRCDETAGALAKDRSGNGHDGAYNSGAFTLNEPGAIYDGDAAVLLAETYSNDWDPTPAGICTPLTSVSISSEFSIEAWVQVSGTLTDDATICATVSQLLPNAGFRFYISDDGKLHFFLAAPPTSLATVTTPNALPSGQYNHCVATFDANQIILYVNGDPVASVDSAFAANGWDTNLCWGFQPISEDIPDSAMFPGTIDECAIYRYALPPGRVFKHHKAGLGPLPVPPTPTAAGDTKDYWEILIFDKKDQLVDIPKADISSFSFNDQLNGGSSSSTLEFVRDFNAIGQIKYLYRVHARFWNGKIPRPDDPTWNGYFVDVDQDKMRTTGKITCHLEGDQKQLDRAAVYEDVNPLVDGNPPLDAADYIRHLYTVYSPPGFCVLDCPATLFPLLPGQYEMMQLGQVIDTVLKTGRDDLGDLIIWRVNCDSNLVRTLLVESDQNPNTVSGVKFKHIFVNEMCSKYTIRTKYSEIGNVVTVQGGQDFITGLPVVGDFIDEDSVATFGGWEQIISVWSLISADACQAYAESWLDTYSNPQANGEIELHHPDYAFRSGVWIQAWENASTIKQMRLSSVRWDGTRSRVKQTLYPTAPTPYLDRAVYKLGIGNGVNGANRVNQLPVNNQQNFVRTGGTLS